MVNIRRRLWKRPSPTHLILTLTLTLTHSHDSRNSGGLWIKYSKLSGDLRNLRKFRIKCTRPIFWSAELAKVSYWICETLENFVPQMQNSLEFCMKNTELSRNLYQIYRTKRFFRNHFRFCGILTELSRGSVKGVRNLLHSTELKKTLGEKTTKRFSFHGTENSSLSLFQ